MQPEESFPKIAAVISVAITILVVAGVFALAQMHKKAGVVQDASVAEVSVAADVWRDSADAEVLNPEGERFLDLPRLGRKPTLEELLAAKNCIVLVQPDGRLTSQCALIGQWVDRAGDI